VATADVRAELARLNGDAEQAAGRHRTRLEALAGELGDEMAPFQARLDAIEAEVRATAEPFQQRLAAARAELDAELAPYRRRREELAARALRLVEAFEPELPARPEPVEPDVDRAGLLFDSTRHWWDPLRRFKEHLRDERWSE
jgi:predicted  nucleic acid-binding Zn-ribbon protein